MYENVYHTAQTNWHSVSDTLRKHAVFAFTELKIHDGKRDLIYSKYAPKYEVKMNRQKW